MTYPVHFRKKVLSYLEEGNIFRKTADKYDLSTATIRKWQKALKPKTSRNKQPVKIDNDALRQDIELYPDAYQRERAIRLNCSAQGISHALKRLGITQKKDIKASKSKSIPQN